MLRAAGVERTIVVQTQHDTRENHWALGLAERHPFIAGVVGWVDLASPDCEEQLAGSQAPPRSSSASATSRRTSPTTISSSATTCCAASACWRSTACRSTCSFTSSTSATPRRWPRLARPADGDRPPGQAADQGPPHRRLAARLPCRRAFPNVFCKLSGMVTEADWGNWTADDLKPYVQAALDAFGPERLMFGSDWPVCELAGTYEEVMRRWSRRSGRSANRSGRRFSAGRRRGFTG